MDAATILDRSTKIIARQDVDRELLLNFINIARKATLRDRDIPRFYTYLPNVTHTNGVIDTVALNIKAAKAVEYNNEALTKLANYQVARSYYKDFTETGNPVHYLELGTNIYILPVPTSGTISMLAEVWPADLTDSPTSDITTTEIPEAWIYLGAAEYLDFFDEVQKGDYFRKKGTYVIDQYLAQQGLQYSQNTEPAIGYYNPNKPSDY